MTAADPAGATVTQPSLFEIRDYHYDLARIDIYEEWAEEAAAVLGEMIDLVGWWVDTGEHEPRFQGSDPVASRHGLPNVTWIIRWDDMPQRERDWAAIWHDERWRACWEQHPGPDGYLQMTSRFVRQV